MLLWRWLVSRVRTRGLSVTRSGSVRHNATGSLLGVCPHCSAVYWYAPTQRLGLVAGLSAECVDAIRKAGA